MRYLYSFIFALNMTCVIATTQSGIPQDALSYYILVGNVFFSILTFSYLFKDKVI